MDPSESPASPIEHSDHCSETPSPSAALAACPRLERSLSTGSSVSSSSRSASGQLPEVPKRGYIRPQATVFADSARNRDSVLSLGSIAHLQYYFARTGLLDGKGAQFAKDAKNGAGDRTRTPDLQFSDAASSVPTTDMSSYPPSQFDCGDSLYPEDASVVGSADQPDMAGTWDDVNALRLPPTVSTYKHKPTYVPPPPDLSVLRRELREALEDARKVLQELQAEIAEQKSAEKADGEPQTPMRSTSASVGWHQVQGLHVLDLVTLAIRAARNYYTSHEQPQRLYSIRPEREIRGELYGVLEILKRVATRNFAGGFYAMEVAKMLEWTTNIEVLALKDELSELNEHKKRETWSWVEGDWDGREREREWLFLKSFDPDPDTFPELADPVAPDGGPSVFLRAMQDGLRLVRLHNELVRSSRRNFGEIKSFHTDTAKPYRRSENLRYWIKAAELRWETLLRVDVNGVVHGHGAACPSFEAAILRWAGAVRREITDEWRQYRAALQSERPVVKTTEPAHGARSVSY